MALKHCHLLQESKCNSAESTHQMYQLHKLQIQDAILLLLLCAGILTGWGSLCILSLKEVLHAVPNKK